jgi:hypothetical protein
MLLSAFLCIVHFRFSVSVNRQKKNVNCVNQYKKIMRTGVNRCEPWLALTESLVLLPPLFHHNTVTFFPSVEVFMLPPCQQYEHEGPPRIGASPPQAGAAGRLRCLGKGVGGFIPGPWHCLTHTTTLWFGFGLMYPLFGK